MGEGALGASSVAKLFFDNIVRFFGIPGEVILNSDPSLTASFWVGAVGFAEHQASDEFCLPSSAVGKMERTHRPWRRPCTAYCLKVAWIETNGILYYHRLSFHCIILLVQRSL